MRILDTLLCFQLQGSQDQPACSFPGEFVQRLCNSWTFSFNAIRGKLERGGSFLRLVSPLLGVCSLQRYAAFIVLGIHDSWSKLH